MQSVLVDTGVWFAMFDTGDEHYNAGGKKAELLKVHRIIIPWPSMYETLRTKLVKNSLALGKFEKYLKSASIVYLDDLLYRDKAFDQTLEYSLRRKRPLSMVDCLIRLLIDDVNIKIRYLATFNKRDFINVCGKRRVEII